MNPSDVQLAARQLRRLSRLDPTLALILGTGFHHVVKALEIDARVAYSKLRGFPAVGVSGHAGELLVGRLGGEPVMILSGRAHYYEGHPMSEVTFPVRALATYGIEALLVTNAAGGIQNDFRAGDFMVLTDHINLMGMNPLRGSLLQGRERFVDLTHAYDPGLSRLLRRAGGLSGATVRSGVYLAVAGPSYETPAEIRAFARLGADAVGMSTVPEVIVARQCGLRVAGLSCITNLAAGRGPKVLSHAEVLDTAERVKREASTLLAAFAKLYGRNK